MRRDAQAYLGVDIGTTSISAVVVDCRGKALKSFGVPNPSAGEPTKDGRHEQDANAILKVVNDLVAECEAYVRTLKLKIVEIGWTGQMHGLVAVDRKLHAVTPFVTWRDRRCMPPNLGSGILEDWRQRKVKGIHLALTIPGYVIARRTGRCVVDGTFLASMGTAERLERFARWIPERDDSLMLGDNQAGVYAAQKLKPGAMVLNLGTSGQLSRVVDKVEGRPSPAVDIRPYPGGRKLVCRASHVGGARLAKLRKSLGYSWKRINDEAESNPRISACIASIVDDLAEGMDMKGVRTVVGVGNAIRLNPCVRKAVEKRLHVKCLIPEVEEMAAWGAALYVMDRRTERAALSRNKRSVIVETLRHEIVLGKYAVNERFPSEQMLVRRFKVARATVSQALAELKKDGILRVKIGSGAFVTPQVKGNGAIGLIVPGRGRGEIFEPICRSIESEVLKFGYSVVSCGTLKGSVEERKSAALAFANRCIENHVAGVIMEPVELMAGKDETTGEILSLLKQMDIPVVLIDRDINALKERSGYDLVGIDNFGAGYKIGELMVAAGARRVSYLSFRDSAPTVRRRICGVAQAVIDAGLHWSWRSVIELDIGDARALADIMQGRNPPDAIVCANDRTASFVIRTLEAIGLKVPKDVRVAGFDDLAYARGSKVPMTTIRQPCAELGKVALRTLIERILHHDLPPREILLSATLVKRVSA